MNSNNDELLQKCNGLPFVYSAIVKFYASRPHIFSILRQIVDMVMAFDVRLINDEQI